MLDFETLLEPFGCFNGRYFEWKIRWFWSSFNGNAPPNGFVIQRIENLFDLHLCSKRTKLSDQEIWKALRFSGEPRLIYWEAWQVKNAEIKPVQTDSWGCDPNAELFSTKTYGTWLQKGTAGFFEGTDLREFGEGWGVKGRSQGSPASGLLPSTTKALLVPNPPHTVNRRMMLSWDSRGNTDESVTKVDWHPEQ